MVAKEMNLQPVEEENELQDFDDAAAETLSLCDLSLNGSASDWDEFSKEDQGSDSPFEQEFFEFFNEDFTACSNYPTDNIIFCGKLITYKGETVVAEKAQYLENTKNSNNAKKSLIFPWKPFSSRKSRKVSSKQQQEKSVKTLQVPLSENRGNAATRRRDDKYDFQMQKVSVPATPIKSRWHLFAIGVGRFPMEMELRDIKMRQSKKSPSRMFQSDNGIQTRSRKSAKGSWGLLRLLGCNSSAMAKATLRCTPKFDRVRGGVLASSM